MGAAVIACSDAPPVLQFSKAVFNHVSLFVERFIVFVLYFTIFLWRNAWLDPFVFQGIAEPVRIITAISQQICGLGQLVDERTRAFVIAGLSCGQLQQNRTPMPIGDGVQL